MAIFALSETLQFPPVHLSEPDGLLAVGGDLNPDRLLLAYQSGIFPWYEKPPILWWSPDPRLVLFPSELKINKSVKPLLNRSAFEFTVNKAFPAVITLCKNIPRAGQDGTWINEEMITAYIKLHEMGYAHSAEVWQDGVLVGGLYGIRIGNIFFGESMFSKLTNASRYAFIKYVYLLRKEGVQLIDCQVYSAYLESMGATMINRNEFVSLLKKNITL